MSFLDKTQKSTQNDNTKVREIASQLYQRIMMQLSEGEKLNQQIDGYDTPSKKIDEELMRKNLEMNGNVDICMKDKSDIPIATARIFHSYLKDLLPAYQEYVDQVFGPDDCSNDLLALVSAIAISGEKDSIPWLKLISYLPARAYTSNSPLLEKWSSNHSSVQIAATLAISYFEPLAALPYWVNELGADYSVTKYGVKDEGRVLGAAFSLGQLNKNNLLTDSLAIIKEKERKVNEQGVIFAILACGVLIMIVLLVRLRNPFDLLWSTYLIFPEEVVAELIALKQRRKTEQVPHWRIRLELAYEILILIWAFQIQIRIDDLKLPPGGNRSAK